MINFHNKGGGETKIKLQLKHRDDQKEMDWINKEKLLPHNQENDNYKPQQPNIHN